MTEVLSNSLIKKHLFITGKSEKERSSLIDEISKQMNMQIYRFNSKTNSFESYIKQVDKLFPYKIVDYHKGKKWNLDQIWDVHLDWMFNNYNNLIILEEFDKLPQNWSVEILRDYLQKSYELETKGSNKINFRLICSLENIDKILVNLTNSIRLNENEKRTSEQFINGKIKIYHIK